MVTNCSTNVHRLISNHIAEVQNAPIRHLRIVLEMNMTEISIVLGPVVEEKVFEKTRYAIQPAI